MADGPSYTPYSHHHHGSESTLISNRPSSLSSEYLTPTSTICELEIDLEAGDEHASARKKSLALYTPPVLEKGVKTALAQPPSIWTRFRIWYNPYRQLFTVVLTLNLVGIFFASIGRFSYAETHTAAFTLGNILAAVAVRNELVLRVVFWLVVKMFQKWTPLWFRVFITAFLQHLGGIHSGTAVSGLAWMIYVVVRMFQTHVATHTGPIVLSWGVITASIVFLIIGTAMPWIRHRHHNLFERNHRFAGWGGLASVWIFVVLTESQTAQGGFSGQGRKLIHSQEFYFATFITVLIFIPWFTVREVPVEISTPSPKVGIIKFQRGIQQGLLGRISRDAFVEYHGFGIISEGIESGCHYMICGVQGDWTRGIVNDPPRAMYTREMKFAGLPFLAHLYRRGICICTGSGIGAVLSTCVQLDNWFLIWIGSDMEATFGPVLFDMIDRRIPKDRYILFDTKKEGCRPDTMRMLKDVYASFQAEVVIITSNPKGNTELMQGCKENNMHAFGPLWDS